MNVLQGAGDGGLIILSAPPGEHLRASSCEVSQKKQPHWAVCAPRPSQSKGFLVFSVDQMMWATQVREKGYSGSLRGDRPQKKEAKRQHLSGMREGANSELDQWSMSEVRTGAGAHTVTNLQC